ncbi:MAG: NTP transferase domain-containing protein [Planctomycetota bacterium]
MRTVAIVPSAGRGERMGADKALLDLGGEPAIARIAAACRGAGVDETIVVRRPGMAALPALGLREVAVADGGEMADSLRAAQAALAGDAAKVVVFPVDHALVAAETVLALTAALDRPGKGIAVPLFDQRPGHPIALRRPVFDEIADEGTLLRDIVRRDPSRVTAVSSANPWIRADLDHPEDLRAARNALSSGTWSVVEQMFRHRSRRAYRSDPVPDAQIARIVDAARHAATSSFIQACSIVAVTEPHQKGECARLCGGQRHIVEAPVFLAICADLHRLARSCRRHDTELQAHSFELFLQATIDAALVGQNLQLAFESEGLGSCMIGGARNHPVELAEVLGLPAHAYVVFGMTVGIAADDPAPRGRMPLPAVLHRGRYDDAAIDPALAAADEAMRAWARAANQRGEARGGRPIDESKGWTDRMAAAWGARSTYAAARRRLVDELRRLGFGIEGAGDGR